jgi:MYXO-CTERM domain-containing protein
MTPSRPVIALSLLLGLGLSLCSRAALADLPGPRDVCDVEGRGCESCWESYRRDDAAEQEAFKKCAEALRAKGLVEACRDRQGAGDAVYFCPAGAKIGTKVVGGGCGACSVGSGEISAVLAAGALGVGLLAMRRRRARRR